MISPTVAMTSPMVSTARTYVAIRILRFEVCPHPPLKEPYFEDGARAHTTLGH